MKSTQPQGTTRRSFLIGALQGAGLASLGGLLWSAHIDAASAAPLALLPPGAVGDTRAFQRDCIKCGRCVQACPYDTLRLAVPGEQLPPGMPHFVPRDVPCEMCVDIPCVPVCPTNALDEKRVSSTDEDGITRLDINRSRMGVAIVDEKACIAFWGLQCDACYRACPLIGEAIRVEYDKNLRTGKHAYLVPRVDADVCTGCGKCEYACVTQEPAIIVLPRDLALGKVDRHYIRGWEEQDEQYLENISTDVTTRTERSSQAPADYLNTGGLLDE